jgi:hypothetical protein
MKTHRNEDPKDGGFLSRKLVLAFVLVQELVVMHLLSARWGSLIPGLEILDGAVVAIFGIYCGANIGNKISVGKFAKPGPAVEPLPEQSPA